MTFEGSFEFLGGERGFGEERRFEEESKKKKKPKNKGGGMEITEQASFRVKQEREEAERLRRKKKLTPREKDRLSTLEGRRKQK